MSRRDDRRSPEAAKHRKLYSLVAWRGKGGIREQQLTRQPLCERCLKAGRYTRASVVNHRTPHKGDWHLFSDPDNLESACPPHHDGEIQSEEALGYSKAIGADGWPSDPRHPANR
jgi:5-methylcytosine-specific restriction protein A